MKKRQVEVTEYSEKCPTCQKEIVALSEARLRYQMKLHRKLSHGEI